MGAFLVYILKSSACVALFFLFYKLLLSGTTFHRLNRVTLLGLLLLSAILPLVHFTWEEGPIAESARPVNEAILFWAAQVESAADIEREKPFPWPSIGATLYLAGLAALAVYGLIIGFSLRRAIGREEARRFHGIRLVFTSRAVEPFSWSRTVVINREDFEREGKAVLAHEMAHVRFGHSADTLFVTLFCLAQWFNPAIWLLRRELREIHEFEADAAVLGVGVNPRDYQLRLIRKAVGSRRFTSMANSFNNNSLKIGGGHTIIANTTIWLQGNNCTIQIGEDFTMEGGAISVTENGKIHIGNDCMFSFGIDIRNGDSHSIFDLNGNRINKAKDIIIGDHVWLGAGVSILKGVKISSNSIIGTKSLVTKNLESPYSIYAGNPAQIIREGAKWCRILKD